MAQRILITGGAGFIGSHLADELLMRGYQVRVLDALTAQVHGADGTWPTYLNPQCELIQGDVRDANVVSRALQGVQGVFHFAAAVGVGQSMYEIAHYTSVNNVGTAVLLECLIQQPVERLVVASSMSVYGEGAYQDARGRVVDVAERSRAQLERGQWDLTAADGAPLVPVPTPETKTPAASSVYALSKYDQERLCLMVGKAYGIPTVALRFFNVYGPRQSLSNPYTGVLAIFAARCLAGNPPSIFEDGRQQRDFVQVRDVAQACRRALESPRAVGEVFNIGSGRPITIRAIAEEVRAVVGRSRQDAEITQHYRVGDIRHCFAAIEKAQRLLGYDPQVDFRAGVEELGEWLEGQVVIDRSARARHELQARGLVV